jgi:hypothetical protein
MSKKSAAEIIGFHFGSDIAEIRGSRYQPTRYSAPAIFTVYTKAGDYWCCPTEGQKLPSEWRWEPVATYYGRTVYVGKGVDE